MPADPAIFSPSPAQAAAVLADLDDCSLSFNALAAKHRTTSDALALWLSTDQIRDRIQEGLDAMALRIRRLATGRLPAAMSVISHIVERHDFNERPLDPASPDYGTEREHRRRRDESVRRACVLLLRLANFFAPTAPPRPRASPLLSGRRGEVPYPRDDQGSKSPPPLRHSRADDQLAALAQLLQAPPNGHHPDPPAPRPAPEHRAPAQPAEPAAPRAPTINHAPNSSHARAQEPAPGPAPSGHSPLTAPPAHNLPAPPRPPRPAIPSASAPNPLSGLSLADLLPDGPLSVTSRAPSSLTARAGACRGAAP